ncbi:carboxypeptidase family protein [Pseudobacter ginsenosidimutans]|uniref:Carboxypeptidase family protein n=2 Tax=Pseudobacter ginsenosidimutans TaxID=661488 RepID=A0A4Q7MPY4_9BACT|nr:carboxypeptidase regulatory-like domain-containing protein [Pseudobacter ginsenosidimutans]RZS70752.1 carboxypeptidase family protein [Pseudobacter ginsenosidimutans]
MRVRKKMLLMTAILPLALLAKANNGNNGEKERGKTEPVLYGMVADAVTKKPVQGVTLSITTAAKGQENVKDRKEYVTDAAGQFKVPQMPPGEVVIVLEKKGYKTYKKENVIIKEGVSLKMNLDLTADEDESDVFHPLMRMMDGD